MGKVKDEQLFSLLRDFLLAYLPVQRKASPHTVRSYRTTLNQLLQHAADQKGIPMMSVTFEMLGRGSVDSYLDWLTDEKGISASTRNNRLAAIRAFVSYAAARRTEYISLASELSAIKIQKQEKFAKVDYMTENAVKALLDEPDTSTRIGLRDQFLMVFLYDTGARVQEVLDVKLNDIRIDGTPKVTLHGKGRKIRIVPLMEGTVEHFRRFMDVFHKGESMLSEEWLFYVERNGKRSAMNDDTVRLRLQKYAGAAREKCPDVPENVHPHLWRHTRAMHLYQHGMDLTLIAQWLGHKDLTTSLIYAHADTEAKRKAIEKAMGVDTVAEAKSSRYVEDDEEILKRLYGL